MTCGRLQKHFRIAPAPSHVRQPCTRAIGNVPFITASICSVVESITITLSETPSHRMQFVECTRVQIREQSNAATLERESSMSRQGRLAKRNPLRFT